MQYRYFPTIVILMAAVAAFNGAAQTLTKETGGTTYQIRFLAAADGKSYFGETTAHSFRTWTQASEYCKLFGMTLATITSTAQFTALKSVASPEFYGPLWTAGRDALETRQFTWNTTGQALTDAANYRGEYSFPFKSCVYYYSLTNFCYSASASCDSNFGTLCETG